MKKSKFTEAQITLALRRAEQGTGVSEVCRKMGISSIIYPAWN
ncbi:MAG TPA: transposase [Flavilitoribacter sp.]|nr:transposase [Flavilitoribacter sp.]